MKKFDIIISGGSYIGLSLAYALSSIGLKVCIIEKQVHKHGQGLGRLFAIASKTCDIYKSLGFAIDFTDLGGAINQIHVMEGKASLDFFPENIGLDNFGYMVEEHKLTGVLKAYIKHTDVELLEGTSITEVVHDDTKVNASLDNGMHIVASLIIGADGKHSAVKKLFNIKEYKHDYNSCGIVCEVRHEMPHKGIATEKFLRPGPFAMLPKSIPYITSLVWTENMDVAKSLKELEHEVIEALIQDRFGDALGNVKLISGVHTFPLQLVLPYDVIGTRMVLVGDAAHSIHPIAGQGFNLGMRDIYQIYQIIRKQKALGLDIGSALALHDYAGSRKTDIKIMSNATHYLNTLFTTDIIGLPQIRKLGINIVDKIELMKALFTTYAVGDTEAVNI